MKLLKAILVATVQVIFFITMSALLFYLFQLMGYKSSRNIGWGISLRLGIYIFSLMVLIINFLWILKLSSVFKNIILLSFIILFVFYWIEDIEYTPYKTTLFLCCAVGSFLSIYLIDRIISVMLSLMLPKNWTRSSEKK